MQITAGKFFGSSGGSESNPHITWDATAHSNIWPSLEPCSRFSDFLDLVAHLFLLKSLFFYAWCSRFKIVSKLKDNASFLTWFLPLSPAAAYLTYDKKFHFLSLSSEKRRYLVPLLIPLEEIEEFVQLIPASNSAIICCFLTSALFPYSTAYFRHMKNFKVPQSGFHMKTFILLIPTPNSTVILLIHYFVELLEQKPTLTNFQKSGWVLPM